MQPNAKMMAARLSKTLRNGERTKTKRPPRRPPQSGESQCAQVQNAIEPRNGQAVILFVRTPAQRTVQVQIDANLESVAKLKKIICDKIVMPDGAEKMAVFTHRGKCLDLGRSNFGNLLSQDVSKLHLCTIQVSMVLPGGTGENKSDKEDKSQVRDEMIAAESWNDLSDAQKSENLQKLDTMSQIELWAQIDDSEDKANFINFLNDQQQKIKFWSSLSYHQQAEALGLLTKQQASNLLDVLDQENLCLTVGLHQHQILIEGITLLDLLRDKQKRLAVETFIECGKASTADITGDQLIENLKEQQYEGFRSIPNLRPDYSYVQVIENQRIEDGMITLADVTNEVKLHHAASGDGDSKERLENDQKAQGADDLPRFLSPTPVDEEAQHYKEWRMDQVNPDPILNEDNRSVIASYEKLEQDKGFWCKESFSITNRFSLLLKGQDGDTFIFSRERPIPKIEQKEEEKEEQKKEQKEEQKEGEEDKEEQKEGEEDKEEQKVEEEVKEANNIKLHLFNFIMSEFNYEQDMKKVRKIEQAVEDKFQTTIDADLSEAFIKEVTCQYDDFVENSNKEQKMITKFDIKNGNIRGHHFNDYSRWIDSIKGKIEGFLKSSDDKDDQIVDKEKFEEFYTKSLRKWLSDDWCGRYVDQRDRCNELYDLLNQLSPQVVDGICYNDIFVYFMKIWFPTWSRLLIKDNCESSKHETYTILEDSHLGKELIKEKQVEKEEGSQYMDQAQNLIKIEDSLLLVYTCATKDGPCLYFYDLQNGRTCAKVSNADLLIDCYPGETDEGVTNTHIRYIKDSEVIVRSVDFKQILPVKDSLNQEIYEIAAEDNHNVVFKCKITKTGSNNYQPWSDRYTGHGKEFIVYANVSQDEDKEKCHKSFQLMFKKKVRDGMYNWCSAFQSFQAVDKTWTFKNNRCIEGAEEFVTQKYRAKKKKKKGARQRKSKTLIQCQVFENREGARSKDLWFYEAQNTEEELRTKDHDYFKFDQKERVYNILKCEVLMKFSSPVIAVNGGFEGLHCAMDNQLSQFNHKQDNKEPKQLQQIIQERKLWRNMFVSYPFLYYTGLTPECREIIVANLADTSQPQRIIQLPEGMQLQNFTRSHLDDRIYFQAFIKSSNLNGQTRGDYEILQRLPFRKNQNYDNHEISIRRVYEEQTSDQNEETIATSMDFICDSHSPNGKLFKVSQANWYGQDQIFMVRDGIIETGNQFKLDMQRTSQDNFYWLENSPIYGTLLKGVFKIRNNNTKTDTERFQKNSEFYEFTRVSGYRMGDAVCLSIVAESKLVGEKQSEVITVLDKDLNLHTFTVNFKEKSFEPLCEVRSLQKELEIDTEWLQFNQKTPLDYESYKLNYKLFSSETLGVIPKDEDYIVFYNINSNQFSIVDTRHDKFPIKATQEHKTKIVKWTKNCAGSDFRLMDCTLKGQHKNMNYLIVYPAPESRKLDLFGFYGRRNNLSTHFISENLFLAQFRYRDIYQNWSGQGSLKLEENYWTILDKTGQIKPLSIQLEKNSSVVFSKQTKQGSMLILNSQTSYQIVKFNLRGDLVQKNSFDDTDIFSKSFQLIQDKFGQQKEDQFRMTNIFLESSKGTLFRLATLLETAKEQEQDSQSAEDFYLGGAIDIPTSNSEEISTDLTVLVFICKSDDQYQQFQEAVFHIAQDSLCFFSPRFEKKSIKIISLDKAEKVEKVKKIVRSKTYTMKANKFGDSETNLSQNLHEEQERKQRAQKLDILDQIEFRSYDVQNGKSQDFSNLDQSPLVRRHSQFLGDFTWIDFDKKSPIREIDLQKSINLYSKSTQFGLQLNSLDSTIKRLNLKVIENLTATVEHNFLQISLPDRVIIYDISFDVPKESYNCFKMNFFFKSQNFINLELPTMWARQKTKTKNETLKWRQVTACHQKNVFIAKDIQYKNEESQENFVSLIKTYCLSDAQGLIWIQEKLDKKVLQRMITPIQSTSFESTLVSYQGHNVFSIFNDQEIKLKKILQFMNDDLIKRKESQKPRMKSLNRRIQKILTMPVPSFAKSENTESEIPQIESSSQGKGLDNKVEAKELEISESQVETVVSDKKTDGMASFFTTALERSIYFDVIIRDLFIELSVDSEEFILSDLAFEQKEMSRILENYSPTLDEFLIRQVVHTPFTVKINKVDWPKKSKKYVTFVQSHQQVNQQQVQDEVSRQLGSKTGSKTKTFEAPITVRMLRNKWLVQNGENFANFSQVLQKCSSESIYDTEFMKVLVQGYWPQTSRIVILRCFLPWILYLLSTIFLFARVLGPEEGMDAQNGQKDRIIKYALSVSHLILIAYQCWIEYVQMNTITYADLKEHFSSLYNIFDILQLMSTLWITIANLPEGGSSARNTHRVVISFSLFIIWFKLFDWLRLWEDTAFYIKLISQTISDIGVFSIIFVIGLAMFGSGMFLLQNNMDQSESPLIPQIFENFLIDMLMNQYMLGLGNFEHNYENHPQKELCWLFLIGATFFTTVTMLNMLVAIMGNTFEEVIEKRAIYIMKSQLQTMSEYSDIINLFENDSQTYLFIVKQSGDEDGMNENDTWEGGFTFLRKRMYKEFMKLRQELCVTQSNQLTNLRDQIKTANLKTKEDQRESKSLMEKIQNQMEDYNGDNKDAIEEMETLQCQLNATIEATIQAANLENIGLKSKEDLLTENVTECAAWIKSFGPEDQAKLEAEWTGQQGQEGKAQREAEFVSLYGQVDGNNDVLLWRGEFNELMQIYQDKRSARDVPIRSMTDQQKLIWFAFFNAQTPGVEGVSIADFYRGFGTFAFALTAELKRLSEEE